ncbi:uncharacterized protein SEPMUDRAFT_109879 [Sphaerulina musiva SO2202]|uniref:Uncharacterized protein n=1 Tax=Sphaerulina musiva (strain SO2202) TaxID=692275 RepID=N1QFR8_SPHMS|nr:uncharacterized protein SEPMUDRAFT_109879 [Sphaerulina musiva SO2202]EMF10592.1 hypothetical protein SEPMUDRAFT_109879 [Sphaerulina musiva SO2202]
MIDRPEWSLCKKKKKKTSVSHSKYDLKKLVDRPLFEYVSTLPSPAQPSPAPAFSANTHVGSQNVREGCPNNTQQSCVIKDSQESVFWSRMFGGKLVGSAASRMDATWKRPYTQYSISMSNMHMAATSLPVKMTWKEKPSSASPQSSECRKSPNLTATFPLGVGSYYFTLVCGSGSQSVLRYRTAQKLVIQAQNLGRVQRARLPSLNMDNGLDQEIDIQLARHHDSANHIVSFPSLLGTDQTSSSSSSSSPLSVVY